MKCAHDEIAYPDPGQDWPDRCPDCGVRIEWEADFTGDHWQSYACAAPDRTIRWEWLAVVLALGAVAVCL